MNKKARYYVRLQQILTSAFFILIIVPTLIITGVTASSSRNEAIEKIKISETLMIEHRKDVINRYLRRQEELLAVLVGLYPLDYLGNQKNLDTVFTAVSKNADIVDLHVINASGEQFAYVGPYRNSLAGKNYKDAPWFQEVLISGRHISDVFKGYRDIPHFVVAVTDPLKEYVLRATINSEIFNSLLHNAQIGPSGDAFILNPAAEFQTPSLQGVNKLRPSEKTLLEHHEGTSLVMIDSFLYATTWMKDGQWLLVIKSRIEDSLGSYYENRNRNLVIIAVTSLVALVAAVLISHFMVVIMEKGDRERANLNQQMVQMEKMATVGRLATGIAHEINNPLQLITSQAGWIQELLEEEEPEQSKNRNEYLDAVKKIKHHVHRAGTVTHRLLGFSKKMSSKNTMVNVNEVIEETMSFVENEARNNSIEIQSKLDPSLPLILTDSSQLQQVILNILNNAIDAMIQNGIIEVVTRADKKNLYMQFSDSGPGITEEVMKHIFDPFFTTKAPGKGTGLGLSICYDIMRKLGGQIEVGNRKEGGAVFVLTLPVTGTA